MNIDMQTYVIYLLVMAGVTLFLRAVPFILLARHGWRDTFVACRAVHFAP